MNGAIPTILVLIQVQLVVVILLLGDGFGGGCYWVAPDLCSNCARGMEWDR